MTRQDYVRIAHALNSSDAPLNVVIAVAAELEADNPRFDWDRFVTAAGRPEAQRA